jgi:hypothetical protein
MASEVLNLQSKAEFFGHDRRITGVARRWPPCS